jgi:DNA polymerase-4
LIPAGTRRTPARDWSVSMKRSPGTDCYWPRAILHVDMNAFFASIEQRDFPELRGRPVGVTNGEAGTTLITCSYEARAFGIKTGMKLYEARRLCPQIVQRPARPGAYGRESARIMRALTDITPDVEVFSVDEAFLDVTHCQRLHGTPEHMARMVQRLVLAASDGLPCSVGAAGTKLTAKYASDVVKPNGITVIPPWEACARLRDVPVGKLCGVGPRIGAFLAQHGAHTCGEVAQLPMNVLVRRYGVTGKHLWLACQGRDTGTVVQDVAPPKSVGHGKVLPPRTTSARTIETYLRHMCEKVAARLRRLDMQTGRLYVGLRYAAPAAGIETAFAVAHGAADGRRFFETVRAFVRGHWHGEAVIQVQVTATHLRNVSGQLELFSPDEVRTLHRFAAIDGINHKYGEFTIAPATLLGRSSMPNVIAPAWRPDGHRQYIPD